MEIFFMVVFNLTLLEANFMHIYQKLNLRSYQSVSWFYIYVIKYFEKIFFFLVFNYCIEHHGKQIGCAPSSKPERPEFENCQAKRYHVSVVDAMSSNFPSKIYFWGYQSIPSVEDQN